MRILLCHDLVCASGRRGGSLCRPEPQVVYDCLAASLRLHGSGGFFDAQCPGCAAGAATERVGSFGCGKHRERGGKFWSLLLAWSSALAVALLRARLPELQPLLEASANRPATKPRPVEVNRN